MKVGFIKESCYPDWLSNPMMVLKSNEKWKTCIDFTYLNKVCPKDSFPLPQIDQLANATIGHELLSFMDVYSGYNHIPMYELNEKHTSFSTDLRLYCYKAMTFSLKNARVTYQRLVNAMFKDLIEKAMEIYVDDMLVKLRAAVDHVEHLGQSFIILRRYQMKLNGLKRVFGVGSGKFIGYVVN